VAELAPHRVLVELAQVFCQLRLVQVSRSAIVDAGSLLGPALLDGFDLDAKTIGRISGLPVNGRPVLRPSSSAGFCSSCAMRAMSE